MRKNKPTLTIGIPAYNEQENLGSLLSDIATQDETTFLLKRVIVASDGSTDATVKIASTFSPLPMTIIANRKRRGKSEVQNQIFERASSDVMVILDADTRLLDKKFLQKLIAPILQGKADLTSAKVQELKPNNFLQQVLQCSMEIKKAVFEEYKKGQNLFTCHGRSRAFSKRFYTELKFENVASEDAYSYLYCKANGYSYRYIKNASVYYQLPSTLSDHHNQSVRHLQHMTQLSSCFPVEFVEKQYFLPKTMLLKHTLHSLFARPVHTISYIAILTFMKLRSMQVAAISHVWTISTTSKIAHSSGAKGLR